MKINTITDHQKAQFPAWVKKWVAIGLSTEPADFDKATDAALRAYKLCNLNKPKIILRMGSPYGATMGGALAWYFMRNSANKAQVWDQVGAQVGAQVGDQVWAQVRDQVGAQVWDQVGAQVRDQVGDQVGAQVRDQVWAQVRDQVGDQVGDQVRAQVGDQVWDQVGDQVWAQVGDQVGDQVRAQVWDQVGAQVRDQVWDQVGDQVWAQVSGFAREGFNNDRGGAFWAGWCAYISYCRDILGWDDPVLERFKIDEDLSTSCGWVWWHENILAISDRPQIINRNENGRLHCNNGPSIAYRDGWELYHLSGVSIGKEMLAYNPKEIMAVENAEQRMVLIKNYGLEKMLGHLQSKTLDKRDEYELLTIKLMDKDCEFLKMVNPSTGEIHIEGVEPGIKKVSQALAWRSGLEVFTNPIVRT